MTSTMPFNLGKSPFSENENKTIVIKHYLMALLYSDYDANTLYNLACCYATTDISTSLFYLKQSINQGFFGIAPETRLGPVFIRHDTHLELSKKIQSLNK